ncbi:ferritin family protein [Pseudaminobacter sp. 19-2017]|uniref:Ferritin family protein n=1 Tax=Pseudaminobacter soli (ex Zhang et al. 2022) TaxID=2831468 RepID=A0A942E5P3_9HYPH|nr:ferritin family protein [Pseudaminobacter soli]MBS3651608.1 ferritin family protein [Pseudaminobacter soli]
MSLLKSEPFAAVTSMDELLAIAFAMEQEAIDGYSKLAAHMRQENRPDMVAVFERLVGEESQHLGNVVHWSERVSGKQPDLSNLRWEPADTFDDEGAGSIAPELLSAYRAFAMAVRNEERAFLFWTYVAAQTDQDKLREAAERMAREELGHLATLRRERRQAFHHRRAAKPAANPPELSELEQRLAEHLDATAGKESGPEVSRQQDLAQQARERASGLAAKPFGPSPLLKDGLPPNVLERPGPLCELLLDCYLDFGERLPDQESRSRAQRFAAGAVECRSFIRALVQ